MFAFIKVVYITEERNKQLKTINLFFQGLEHLDPPIASEPKGVSLVKCSEPFTISNITIHIIKSKKKLV